MKLVNTGRNIVLQRLLKSTEAPASLYIGLYKNATEPALTAVLTDLTEQSGNGYARIQLVKADWTITDNQATQAQVTFTCSTTAWGNIYGYFICDSASGTSGNIYIVDQFLDGPYYILPTGQIHIIPKIVAT